MLNYLKTTYNVAVHFGFPKLFRVETYAVFPEVDFIPFLFTFKLKTYFEALFFLQGFKMNDVFHHILICLYKTTYMQTVSHAVFFFLFPVNELSVLYNL